MMPIISMRQSAPRNFCARNLYDESTKTLRAKLSAKDKRTVAGFAEDYAFVIQGLLDLYEAYFDVGWLQFALELQETQDKFSSTKRTAAISAPAAKTRACCCE